MRQDRPNTDRLSLIRFLRLPKLWQWVSNIEKKNPWESITSFSSSSEEQNAIKMKSIHLSYNSYLFQCYCAAVIYQLCESINCACYKPDAIKHWKKDHLMWRNVINDTHGGRDGTTISVRGASHVAWRAAHEKNKKYTKPFIALFY